MAGKKGKRRVKRRVAKKRVARKKLVKKVVKKRLTKKKVLRKAVVKKPKENIVGVVTHYFPQVKAAVIKLKAPLSLGDTVKIKGHTTDFIQPVNSLQIELQPITTAKRGQEIGLLVGSRVRHNDIVYRV